MIFNAWAATNPRLKKQAHREAKITKPPVSPVSVTKEELKSMAAQAGWEIRELTHDDVQRMSSSELRFHESFNRDSLDRAFELEQNKRLNREHNAVWDIRAKWEGRKLVTPGEAEEYRRAGATFAERHPTFERTEKNALAICRFMADHDLDPKLVSSYVEAFNALVETGQMKLAPVLSSDEYLAANADTLVDKRTPPLIEARRQREQNTAAHFAKSAAATSEGGVTRVVDFPHEPHGVPPQPDKVSFRKRVQAMSADDIRRECEINPAFREALDSLK